MESKILDLLYKYGRDLSGGSEFPEFGISEDDFPELSEELHKLINPGGEITEKLIDKIYFWLGDESIRFFKHLKGLTGKFDPILKLNLKKKRVNAYPVGLREGMRIQNYMRFQPECDSWSEEDIEERWTEVLELVVKKYDDLDGKGLDKDLPTRHKYNNYGIRIPYKKTFTLKDVSRGDIFLTRTDNKFEFIKYLGMDGYLVKSTLTNREVIIPHGDYPVVEILRDESKNTKLPF